MAAAGQQDLQPRPLAAKGRRPQFLDDPDSDRLLAMIMALTGELAVLRERLDTPRTPGRCRQGGNPGGA